MASANPKWPRYVKASLTRYLLAVAAPVDGLALIVNGVHTDTNPDYVAATYKAEATIAGPFTREISKNYHRVWVTVTIVLSGATGNEQDVFRQGDIAGKLVEALDACIDVREYEASYTEGDPAPELVGHLRPSDGANDHIGARDIKPTDADKLRHTFIEARFIGYFPQD